MATAILDLDITRLPASVSGLHQYEQALVLIRFKGRPIGKTTVPLFNGGIDMQYCYTAMAQATENVLWSCYGEDMIGWQDNKDIYPLPKATIAICTRNRTADLRRCLEGLTKLPDQGQEILVIDNAPSDESTAILVAAYPAVKYIREERAGLNIARNRALREAAHDIVVFADDDTAPDRQWLDAIIKPFQQRLVMCTTGLTMPLELETPAQEAFERYSPFGKGFYRIRYSAATHNPLATGQVGAGANMAFRKTVTTEVGWFDEALDAGTATKSGGDHEFFCRILLAGYQIVYEPSALNWHRHRRTLAETKKAIRGYGVGVYAYWTRLLFVQKEMGIIKLPVGWFFYQQLPNLLRSVLKRPGSQPLSFLMAELAGCMAGPFAYFRARRRLKKTSHANTGY